MVHHASTNSVLTHTLNPQVGSRGHFFLKVVVLHIKLKETEHKAHCKHHVAPCKHIFCPYTHPRTLGLGQKVQTFFNAYQIKRGGT